MTLDSLLVGKRSGQPWRIWIARGPRRDKVARVVEVHY